MHDALAVTSLHGVLLLKLCLFQLQTFSTALTIRFHLEETISN